MNPAKVVRKNVSRLTDLPNVGPATQGDLILLGILEPSDLIGKDAYSLYDQLCERTGVVHDPCVIDVFLSITDFMKGGKPKPWWKYTQQRKAKLKSSQK